MSENTEEKAGPTAEPGGETLPAERQGVTLGQLTAAWLSDPSTGLRSYLKEQAEQLSRAALMPTASMLEQITQRQDWLASIVSQRPAFESIDLLAGAREAGASFDNIGDLLKRLSGFGDIAELANPLAGAEFYGPALAERFDPWWPLKALPERGERRQPKPAPEIRVIQAGAYVELEPAPPQPRRPALPPPPAPLIKAPKESEPAWQAFIQREIEEGRATWAQMLAWLKQQAPKRRPGVQAPSWAEIELICLDYERNGHKYANQEVFARRHSISRATLSRYLRLWRLGEGQM